MRANINSVIASADQNRAGNLRSFGIKTTAVNICADVEGHGEQNERRRSDANGNFAEHDNPPTPSHLKAGRLDARHLSDPESNRLSSGFINSATRSEYSDTWSVHGPDQRPACFAALSIQLPIFLCPWSAT
jgi:hypothetical protein